MKSKSKILIAIFTLLLIFSTFCYATDESSYQPMDNDLYEDLYAGNEDVFNLKNTIKGNGFITTGTLNIDPENNGGVVEGDLFVTAGNVNIKSDVTYSDSEKDGFGNSKITINKYSSISGNVYALTNKFVLEPGSQINGDLYVCANEVTLEQNAKVNGNVFVVTNNLYLNSEINGSLYATAKTFNMDFYGFINRDLHLSSANANINGYIYRNSIIEADELKTNDKFINQKDFTVTNANKVVFSGEVNGNANINAKEIIFMDKNGDQNINCKISGNLKYSSNNNIEIPDGITGDTIHSEYINKDSSETKTVWSVIGDYIKDLVTLLIISYVVYFIVSKYMPNYLDKISDITAKNLLKYIGIGLGLLILIPIIALLLLLSGIGHILGFVIALIYIAFILISIQILIVAISKFAKNSLKYDIKVPLYILIISAILVLTYQIPFLGGILSTLINITGFGMITKHLIPNKKEK